MQSVVDSPFPLTSIDCRLARGFNAEAADSATKDNRPAVVFMISINVDYQEDCDRISKMTPKVVGVKSCDESVLDFKRLKGDPLRRTLITMVERTSGQGSG